MLSVTSAAVSGALLDSALFHLRSACLARLAVVGDGRSAEAAHSDAAHRCLLRASQLDLEHNNGAVRCLLMARAAEAGDTLEAQRWAHSMPTADSGKEPDTMTMTSALLVSRHSHSATRPLYAASPVS